MSINNKVKNKKVINDFDSSNDKIILKSKTKTTKKTIQKNNIDDSYLRLPSNEIIIQLETSDNKGKSESKKNIIKMIDKAHNYLYNYENIEGEEALNDIMNLLFIKSIQPIISNQSIDGKIDLLNKTYYTHLYDDKQLDKILNYFVDLKSLTRQPLDAIRKMSEPTDIIRQMGEILKTHPITGQIFNENNFLKAKKAPTIQGILNNIIIPLSIEEIESNEDVIGEIYEHIINGYVKKGSKLGQFFTPRRLMKLIFEYKLNRINDIISKIDLKSNIKFYDSCMGTSGWLVTAYNLLKDKYPNRILLSGGEVKSTTFQYGLMNLILTLKEFPHDVQCESSLTHINQNKHHFILTNPPFQTDKKFNQLAENFKSDKFTKNNLIKLDDVYDLKDNSPPIQFLELNLFKLEENGMCLIVLPYGELFFGSSNKEVRKHFMKETNITDIIIFPSGVFTHAGVKSCALIFEKDKKGTKDINFIQANLECNILTKITSITINDIEKQVNNSWYHRDYLEDEYIEKIKNKLTKIDWIPFDKIFTLEKGIIQSTKVEDDDNGNALMITQSQNINDYKKISKYKLDGSNLFIGNIDTGKKFCLVYYEGKCDFTNLLSVCKINNKYENKINIKFIFYFLKQIHDHLTNSYLKGSSNLSLDIRNFNRIKIPIPSLDIQINILNRLSTKSHVINMINLIKKDILINVSEDILSNLEKTWEKNIDNILINDTNKFIEYLSESNNNIDKIDEEISPIIKTKSKTKSKTTSNTI